MLGGKVDELLAVKFAHSGSRAEPNGPIGVTEDREDFVGGQAVLHGVVFPDAFFERCHPILPTGDGSAWRDDQCFLV